MYIGTVTISVFKDEKEKFLYKYLNTPKNIESGIILYRNAFSISSYEGRKDWLGLGKRSRKSPAAASHPTGAWRVRENQMAGYVMIDKKKNAVLQDMANRQGLDENIYYQLFVEIILVGIKEFERYRQNIVRKINAKNQIDGQKATPISDRVLNRPTSVSGLTKEEAKKIAEKEKFFTCLKYIDDFEKFFEEGIEIRKFVAFHEDIKLIEKLKKIIGEIEGLAVSSSFNDNIEITDINAQKGIILEKVITKMGIDKKDVMILGDSFNDYSMFEIFEESVAMKNAISEIKKIAKYITDTNDNQGVAKAIYNVLNNKMDNMKKYKNYIINKVME